MKIRAAVAEKQDMETPKGLQVQYLELDDNLHEKEVLVRVVACAVCNADLAARDGHVPFPLPCVLGHEGTGIVERVGSKVERVKAGDHVLMTFPNDASLVQARRRVDVVGTPLRRFAIRAQQKWTSCQWTSLSAICLRDARHRDGDEPRTRCERSAA